MLIIYRKLISVALSKFKNVVERAEFIGGTSSSPNKLRLFIADGSFLDVWLSFDGDYSYHWEHRRQTGKLYRWDNAPHHPAISTFPDHFHKGEERTIVESYLNSDPVLALRTVLEFIEKQLS